MADARFREIPVRFRDGRIGTARATGNNAAWLCPCNDPLPLLATSFPPSSHTVCPNAHCRKRYRLDLTREFVEEIA